MQQEESKTRVQGEIKVSGRRYKHDNVLLTIWYTPIGRIINDTSSMNNDTATPNNRTSLILSFSLVSIARMARNITNDRAKGNLDAYF